MPSTTSSSVSRLLASSTVMTPSLPTFFMASAILAPISLSPLAEMVPTWAISSLEVTFLAFAFSSSTTAAHGQVDAALQVHRVGAGRHRLGALADDRLRQHGCRRRAVAGDVGGLGGDLLQHLRAHVLELVLELDLLGDGHAVLGDARGAEALLEHDVAALGAQRHLDGVGENVDAAQHALAGVLGEFDVFGCHCWLLQGWEIVRGGQTAFADVRERRRGRGAGV